MKKIVLAFVIIIVVIIGFIIKSNSIGTLANINKSYLENETGVGSSVSFSGKEGDEVDYNIDVKSGELILYIINKDKNTREKIVVNTSLRESYIIKESGIYEVTIEYKNFTGSYNVKAY